LVLASSMRFLRLFPVYLVVFTGFVGYSMMIAVFTPMFLHGYGRLISPGAATGLKTSILGVVLCMYPLGQFLSAPPIGALSDRYGRRRVLLISLIFSICCYCLIASAIASENLWLLIIALLAAGLSEGNIVIAQSAVSDVSETIDRGRLFGYIYMSASLAYVIGPLLGGELASPAIVPWFSYVTPFWAMLVPLLITWGAVALLFRETHQADPAVEINLTAALGNLFAVIRPTRIRILYFVNFALYLGVFGFFRCYPMYMVDEFHLDVSQVSQFIAWLSVPIIIGSLWLAGLLTAKFPIATVTVWSGLLTGVTMILIIIPSFPGALWLTLFLVGLPLSVCMASCAAMLSISVPAEEQGRALGNNQALQVFAEALSGLIGGFVAAVMVKASLLTMAAFVFAGVVLLRLSLSKKRAEETETG
jgi:DHA1 family tetracycline resistance protein-like MFS transporter